MFCATPVQYSGCSCKMVARSEMPLRGNSGKWKWEWEMESGNGNGNGNEEMEIWKWKWNSRLGNEKLVMETEMYSAKTFPHNYSYTTWKCFHNNPKVRNHENDNFLKRCTFSMAQLQKLLKCKFKHFWHPHEKLSKPMVLMVFA